MAEKQKPKPTPKPKPTKKMTQAEQSERFKETARALGAEESGQAFARAIERILPPTSIRRDKPEG
jgi:hypothetical protein